MKRYKSRRERRSRLADQEAKRVFRQTILIVVTIIVLLVGLVFVGVPAFMKLAIFLADIRGSSQPIEQQDTIPPATPQINTLPTATNSAKLTIRGFAEPGSTVELYINGVVKKDTIVDDDGSLEISLNLSNGLNRIYTMSIDAADNESLPSNTQTIVLDKDIPTLTVNSPSEGDQFFGQGERMVTISGQTDPGNTIRANGQVYLVQNDGSFSGRFQLEEGDNKISLEASDTAGNKAQSEINLKYYP